MATIPTYIVHKTTDVLQESTGEGNDSVFSSVSYTLAHDIEQLTLTGTPIAHGTGNSIDNIINGNDAINRLDGADGNDTLIGGLGVDNLQGGAGADIFVFKNDSAFANVDIVRDYSHADGDVIDVKDIVDTTTSIPPAPIQRSIIFTTI